MRFFMTFFYLLLVAIGISFAGLNASYVDVHFYFTNLNLPISMLVMLTLSLGVVLGFSFSLYRYWRLKSNYRTLKNQLKWTEQEIKNLRAIPLQDSH